MTSEEFNLFWELRYPECFPIAHYLKFVYSDRWFRIHTLPESKRYAETEDEYLEMLSRHNRILSDIFGDEGRFVLLTCSYSDTPTPVRPEPELEQLLGVQQYVRTLAIHEIEGDDDVRYRHLHICERIWKPRSIDGFLRIVADDVIANVMFVGLEQKRIYHPYDGGGDVVLESEESRDAMKAKYASWLPKHPEGL